MRRTHTLVNDSCDQLEVWVELWADLYILRRGSKLAFSYVVEDEADLVESEVAEGRITFWFTGPDAPDVTIDGIEAQPVDQYEWLGRMRERPS